MRTIKSKLLLVVVVPVVFLTLCSLAIFVICDIYQINTAGYRSAVSFAHISTKNIDSWLKIKKNIISGYFELEPEPLKAAVQTKLHIRVNDISDLFYGDADGKTYSGLGTPEKYQQSGYDPRKRDWYILSKSEPGKIIVSKPYIDVTLDKLVVTISEGYSASDKGVLGLDLLIDDITDTISNLNLPQEGEAYLVYDDDNKIIVSSTEKSLFNQPLGSVYPELSPDAINELMKKEQTSNSFSSVKLNHGDFFILSERLKEAPWKLVVILDRNSYMGMSYIYIGVIFVISLLILTGTILYIARAVDANIVKPVHHVGSMLRELAEKEPNFNNKIEVRTDDEIGELAYNFNLLLDNQKQLFNEINGFLKNSTRDSIDSNEKISDQINEQQNELEEVIISVDHLGTSISNIENCIGETEKIADNITSSSMKGKEMVEQSGVSIRELSDSISKTSEAIATVSECATSIFSVVGSIKDIADQTNLLALNAAIESARAGEHGRGFAVVADEVRSLSVKTGESAVLVQQSIKTLQDNVGVTVSLMKQSMNDCQSTMSCVNSMNESINSIISTVERISDNTEAIRNATCDQSGLIDDTNSKIMRVNDSNTNIIKTISENKEKTMSLSRKADEIAMKIGTN